MAVSQRGHKHGERLGKYADLNAFAIECWHVRRVCMFFHQSYSREDWSESERVNAEMQ